VFVKRSKPRGVRVASYPKSVRSGLSQPRWMSESPRVSTRDRRSCLTFVSDHQPPNVVGKTLMIPVYQRLFGVSDNFDGGVRVGRFVFVGAAHVCKWGPWGCAELPGGVAFIIAGIPSVRDRRHAKVKPTSTLSTPARGIRASSKNTTAC
jgi:hypothetical protein